jgi:hypothetical protein
MVSTKFHYFSHLIFVIFVLLLFCRHRQEIAPLLFGTGRLTLEDPENDIEEGLGDGACDGDETTAASSVARSVEKGRDYGATETGPQKPIRHWGAVKKTVKAAAPAPKITVDEESGEPKRPRRSWCLEIFFFINGCAMVTCLGAIVSQMLPLFMVPLKQIEPVEVVLAIYISLFAVLFMVIEWGTFPFFSNAVDLFLYHSFRLTAAICRMLSRIHGLTFAISLHRYPFRIKRSSHPILPKRLLPPDVRIQRVWLLLPGGDVP